MPAVNNRSIQLKLAKDDVLFLLDMPQSGAHLWNPILEGTFTAAEIFPLHSDAEALNVANYTPAILRTYRYVSGEFMAGPLDGVIYRHLTPNPLRVAAFRQAVKRVVAVYEDAKKAGKVGADTTLEQFVRDEANFNQVWNVQTRLVVGAVPGNIGNSRAEITLSETALLFVAKQNIEQFNALLIDERMADSADLLNYCVGLKVKPPVEGFAPLPEVSPSALAAIQERTQLDQKLYEAACHEFQLRYKQMHDERLARSQRTLKEKFLEAVYPSLMFSIRMMRATRKRYFPANTSRDILRFKFTRKMVNGIIKLSRTRK